MNDEPLAASQPSDWLLYGANGYTGRLIAEEAVRRGMRPTLAGRDERKIKELAEKLDCPSRVFPLDDPDRIASYLAGHRAVLHCAGPFSATAAPMMEACLAAGVHYLDITGEISVIEAAAALGDRAVRAGVTLLPAAGFDVVPSDCLAAMLAARLPGATHLQLAFTGTGSVSPGTARTMLEALPGGGRARIDGRITWVPAGWKSLEIPFRDGPRQAVTVPWGDVASAFYSTGIPNIEVYLAVSPRQVRWLRRLRRLLPLVRLPLPQGLLRWGVRRFIAGPSAEERRTGRGSFWGRVSDAQGRSVEATLITPSGYELTVWTALACLEKVLAGAAPPGFTTPSKAFGPEFILTVPGTDVPTWGTDGN
jgi:short subunit dehydrogenase-like uncharacterized protein